MGKNKTSGSVDPREIIGEVLGRRASLGFDPASADFICPYIESQCTKRGKNVEGPYPVCSIWRGTKGGDDAEKDLIIVCPKRFYEVSFLQDVIDRCWPTPAPVNPRVAPEVTMKGFGNVDFVIADLGQNDEVGAFLSVELQAIDITGSVINAYRALIAGGEGKRHPRGFNWDNVYKRYVTQLVRKGFFHHHWGSKIVAVLPDQVFQYILDRASFLTTEDLHRKDSNIIFLTDVLKEDGGKFVPKLIRGVGTSHSSLQSAMMYAEAPAKSDFAARVKSSLTREVALKGN